MADSTTLARPYARATFDIARDAGELAGWSDFLAIAAAAVEDAPVRALLDEPARTPAGQAELIASLYPEPPAADKLNLLRLLAQNERLDVLPEVAELYAELRASAENTLEVEVTSVEPLDDASTSRLAEALRNRLGRDIRLVNRTDPELIGGAVVKAGDLVIDGSARARLERLGSSLRA
jgi:F-type H+-transporting ATPase subunit delta